MSFVLVMKSFSNPSMTIGCLQVVLKSIMMKQYTDVDQGQQSVHNGPLHDHVISDDICHVYHICMLFQRRNVPFVSARA